MRWTDTTRPHYRRDDLRYASDLRAEEWVIIEPFMPEERARASPHGGLARGGQRHPVYRLDRVPMADVAEGFSAPLDRAALFLSLAR